MSNQPSSEDLKAPSAEADAAVVRPQQSDLDSAGGDRRIDQAHGESGQAGGNSGLAGEISELKAVVQTLRNEISERKRIEAELKTSEKSGQPLDLSQFYKNVPVGLASLDLDLRFVHINEWLAAIDEFSVQEHLGRTIGEALPEVAARIEPRLRQVIETGEPILEEITEAETTTSPRIVRTFQHSIFPIKSDDHTIIGVGCAVQEITERKQAEIALRVKTDQLGAVSDAMTAFLDSGNWREASATILRSAMNQTSSQYGFVGVVAGGSTLRILSHEGIEWDEVIGRELYEQVLRDYDNVGYAEFTNFENLFGKVITSGRAVISNDPPNDPRSAGRPQGHPPLRHFLGVPILKGREVVGMIGVANRPSGYMGAEQKDIEILCRAASVLYDSYRRQQHEDSLKQMRKRAEEALRESERQLRVITDNLPAPIAYVDSEQRYRFANPAYARWFGRSVQEVVGTPVRSVVGEAAYRLLAERIDVVLSGQQVNFEVWLPLPDGTEACARERYVPHFTKDRQIQGFFVLATDVTERKQAEEAVNELNVALSNATPGISRLDTAGRYLEVNDYYAHALGYEPKELLGSDWSLTVQPEDRPCALQAYEDMCREGKGEFEAQAVRKDGSSFYKQVLMIRIDGADGEMTGHHCFMRDITKRKQAEERLRQRERELAHVERLNSMGQMVAEITHEINQPLYSIANFSKACINNLEAGDGGEQTVSWLRRIDESATMAGKILDRVKSYLLDKEVGRSTIDLHEVVAESMDLVSFDTTRRQVTIQIERSSSSLDVCVSHVQIQQVLVNLVKNACEAMEHVMAGERLLTIRLSRAGKYAEITVTDNGAGIAEETADRLFDTFFTTKTNGMGMGLSVCRSIIEDHGGTIGTVPASGRGAAFRFTIPLARGSDRARR